MQITPLATALSFPDGTAPEAIRGTLKYLDAPKSGGSGDKTWTVYSGKLVDGNSEIKIKFWRTDIDMSLKGQTIVVSGRPKEKGSGFIGLKIVDNEYKGKVSKELHVRDDATIDVQGGAPAPAHVQAPQPAAQQPAANYAPPATAQANGTAKQGGDDLKKAKRGMSQLGSFYVAAYKVGLLASAQIKKDTGEEIGQDVFQAMVSSIVIQSEREGYHFAFPPLDVSGPPPWEQNRRAAQPPVRPPTPPPAPEPEDDSVPF